MNYTEIESLLTDYDKAKVSIFVSYLKEMEGAKNKDGTLKNKWFPYFKPSNAVALYKKVAIDNLYIDGDTITIVNKGKVMVSYNYQAYKNRLLNIYPETKFDLQIVNKGDLFTFKKESGKVYYTHELLNPFELEKKIVGCYCIIKNNRGEFIEILNMDDIAKMRNVAKTKKIWDEWFSEMVLKSGIKRACKRHFKDIVVNLESLDNENYDLETVNFDFNIKDLIEDCKTLDDLTAIYEKYKSQIKDEKVFLSLLGEKKKEVLSAEDS